MRINKKNKRVPKKVSVIRSATTHIGAIILMFLVMAILNVLSSSRCQQLSKAVGDRERELDALKADLARAEARWADMKTPERIGAALLRHGLAMKPPRPDQNVHMKANGTPYPGQTAVARASRRRDPTASYRRAR